MRDTKQELQKRFGRELTQSGNPNSAMPPLEVAANLKERISTLFSQSGEELVLKEIIALATQLVELENVFAQNIREGEYWLASAYIKLATYFQHKNILAAIEYFKLALDHIDRSILLNEKEINNKKRKEILTFINHFIMKSESSADMRQLKLNLFKSLLDFHSAAKEADSLAFSCIMRAKQLDQLRDKIPLYQQAFSYLVEAVEYDRGSYYKSTEKELTAWGSFIADNISTNDYATGIAAHKLLSQIALFMPDAVDPGVSGCNFAYFYFESNRLKAAFEKISQFKDYFDNERVLRCYIKISEFYAKAISESQPEKATALYKECIELNKNLDIQTLIYCKTSLASIYYKYHYETHKRKKQHELADEYLNLCINLLRSAIDLDQSKDSSINRLLIAALISNGITQEELSKKYHSSKEQLRFVAKDCYEEAIDLAQKNNELLKLADAYYFLGQFYDYHIHDNQKSFEYQNLGIQTLLCAKLNDKSLTEEAHEQYLRQYEKIKDDSVKYPTNQLRELRKAILNNKEFRIQHSKSNLPNSKRKFTKFFDAKDSRESFKGSHFQENYQRNFKKSKF